MEKKTFGSKPILFPMPTVLVGTAFRGKINYMTVAYVGIVGNDPALIAISPGKQSYTHDVIPQIGAFSVNIPSASQVEATDWCGIASGKGVDKSGWCQTFFGQLPGAPLIQQCPINLECKLVHTFAASQVDIVFIGEIIQVHVSLDCLTDGRPDIAKVRPILYGTADDSYWELGPFLAKAFQVGKYFDQKDQG